MSGWTYPAWRSPLYPPKLAHARELAYTAGQAPTIELNGSFEALQKPPSYEKWYEHTRGGFVFAMKAPKFITHHKKRKGVESAVINFLLSGPLRLNEKLGPILWQLPATVKFDAAVMEAFLSNLRTITAEAAGRVKETEPLVKGRLFAEVDQDRPLRHAIEVRHHSFANEPFVRVLRKHRIAVVNGVTAGIAEWPVLRDLKADFAYARLHGETSVYFDGYTDNSLRGYAKRDVYVYYDVTNKVHAPENAMRLAKILNRK